MMKRVQLSMSFFLLLLAVLTMAAAPSVSAQTLTLNPGEHICIIGNTLGDRMQHFGWTETRLYARFPKHNLVIRNLAFSGDELTLRLRSKDFGTPDEWLAGSAPIPQPDKLTHPETMRKNRFELAGTKADVIFAFFGYNESFAGPKGLDKFKQNLDATLKGMLKQQYNGKSTPRIALFSPIAQENLHDPNLPDGSANNQNLELYTTAMAEVARANQVVFVDLFKPTLQLYAKARQPLTINGVHLNEQGYHELAAVIEQGLFGDAPKRDAKALARLREAVLDKNSYWFHRYRVTDGYSTYGERAFLTFRKGYERNVSNKTKGTTGELLPTNYEVLQRELEVLDVMTANRDQHIWSVAEGKNAKIDDSNTPPFITTESNKPGKNPDGSHSFLSGAEAIKAMTVAKGMKVSLFASEEKFPVLSKPVQMAFDARGRLWVATWPSYPHWQPKSEMNDKLLILEDTDGDGEADSYTVFADHLHNPTGFEFYNGGVFVAQVPDILFLKDTNGDDKADVRERIIDGMDSADTHHSANSFAIDPGGALYWQEGTFHHTQVETPWGPTVRNVNAGVYRFEPRTFKFEVYVAYNFANPHGHVFDYWGRDIVDDGTGAVPYFGSGFSGHTDYPNKHPQMKSIYKQRTRPCPGTEILSSRHFPDDMQGDYLVANVIGFQGILQYRLKEEGSGLVGTEVEPLVQSSDPNFRPSDVEVGPDGAIYFTEWQNPIIGHMQHNLRDPSRDHVHGRVYRITYPGRPLLKPAKIAGQPIPQLLDLLKEPEDRVRYRAKIELSARKTADVMAALKTWVGKLDQHERNYEHHMMEALWVHQYHNVVNEDLLQRMLRSPEPHARAAATRVLCCWRDRVKDPLTLLKAQVNDDHPWVRLEAVRACSFFPTSKAAEVALDCLNKEQNPDKPDYYIKYALDEALKTLEKYQ